MRRVGKKRGRKNQRRERTREKKIQAREKVEKLSRCGAAHVEAEMHETPQSRRAFESSDVIKVHALVARGTSPRHNVENTSSSERF